MNLSLSLPLPPSTSSCLCMYVCKQLSNEKSNNNFQQAFQIDGCILHIILYKILVAFLGNVFVCMHMNVVDWGMMCVVYACR